MSPVNPADDQFEKEGTLDAETRLRFVWQRADLPVGAFPFAVEVAKRVGEAYQDGWTPYLTAITQALEKTIQQRVAAAGTPARRTRGAQLGWEIRRARAQQTSSSEQTGELREGTWTEQMSEPDYEIGTDVWVWGQSLRDTTIGRIVSKQQDDAGITYLVETREGAHVKGHSGPATDDCYHVTVRVGEAT